MSNLHSSQADVWHLKQIAFPSTTTSSHRPIKIITQNFNGPCSFIAICNILVLRGKIEILPADRTTVSYEFLSQLLAEYLLTNCPDIDISAALSIMPTTTKGLDLNPQFTSVTEFSPASDAGELSLFAQAGIQLVHGWVVDPDSPEAHVMAHIQDYDTAVTLIADADYITQGRLLGTDGRGRHYEEAGPSSGPGAASSRARQSTSQYSDVDQRKIEQAIVAQQFLDATKSQLTYHGLFQLAFTLQPGSLVALFRNAHLSVVYKSPSGNPGPEPGSLTLHPLPESNSSATGSSPDVPIQSANSTQPLPIPSQDSALYALVTDDIFLHEPSIVWERLEDIDGGSSWFVDSDFHRAVPVGGDVAGQTAEAALRRLEMEAGVDVDPADQALARQMQADEDARAREMYIQRQQTLERRRVDEEERRRSVSANKSARIGKKVKGCVLM